MNNNLSTKSKITVTIIIIVVILFIILKISPHTPNVPQTTSPNQTATPILTATTTTLKLGDHITIGTTLLTPTEVIQGSPVILAVNASSDSGADVINLPLNQKVIQDGLTVTLTAITPPPSTSVNPADYRFTISIAENLQ